MKIFVGNLSFQSTEDDLRPLFAEFGEVASVQVVKDRETGRARGFAFVEMPNDEEARKAMAALNGRELSGRTLNVNEARPKSFGGGRGGPRASREPRW